jgi:hypothetical protein
MVTICGAIQIRKMPFLIKIFRGAAIVSVHGHSSSTAELVTPEPGITVLVSATTCDFWDDKIGGWL